MQPYVPGVWSSGGVWRCTKTAAVAESDGKEKDDIPATAISHSPDSSLIEKGGENRRNIPALLSSEPAPHEKAY